MASAGRDIRVAAGARSELHGLVARPVGAKGRVKVRWTLRSAPARSALQADLAPIGAARASVADPAAAHASAVEPGAVEPGAEPATIGPEPSEAAEIEPAPPAFEEAATLTPVFAPDVTGRYTVQMTASSAAGTSTDEATIYVVPSTPMITLQTETAGQTTGSSRPGIQIGSNFLPAPYLRTAGGTANYSGSINGIQYKAIFQIVALERATTALKWNRTYGICQNSPGGGWYPCRAGEPGSVAEAQVGAPVPAKPSEELSAAKLGVETLLIASSHAGGGSGMEWAAPDEAKFVDNELGVIGFPGSADKTVGPQVAAAKAGEMAGVGVPGLEPGQATITVGAGSEGLNGYLTPDSNVPAHYSYMPPQRIPFDTRASYQCNGGGCSVTQRIGGPDPSEVTGTVKKGDGGFLVSGFNRFTLAPIEHKTFETALFGLREPEEDHPKGPAQKALDGMKGFLAELAKKEAIVLVTSIHGQGQNPNTLYTFGTTSWKSLGLELAAFGGTKEELIDGGTTPGDDYSLIGVAKMEEGTAPESSAAGARLRGFLVPDNDSIYRPQSVNPTAAPNEKLMDIVLQRPGAEAWPDEGNEEVMKAMAFIGRETKLLGSRPRFAYWNNLTSNALASEALTEVKEKGRFEAGQGFSGAAFEKAKRDLYTELPLVKSVRLYMELLGKPAGTGANAWQKAATIGAELKDLLEKLKEKSKAQSEYLSFLAELLEIGAILTGDGPEEEALQKFIEAAAVAAEAGQTLWNTNYDGSETKPSIEVEADRLGEELVRQAVANEKSFTRFGDILVSDWSKLRVMGTYGGCNPEGSCGKNGEYDELAYEPKMAALAEKNTTMAFERELYSKLVPLAFPIWNTGESEHESNNEKFLFYCRDISYPFEEAPELAYFRSPSNFLPGGWKNPETGNSVWNVYLSVARSRRTYGYPSPAMLGRMFNPLSADKPSEEGLQMNRGDFFREGEKINKYVPSPYCYWEE
jgi:hypothetical protein